MELEIKSEKKHRHTGICYSVSTLRPLITCQYPSLELPTYFMILASVKAFKSLSIVLIDTNNRLDNSAVVIFESLLMKSTIVSRLSLGFNFRVTF